MGKFEDKKNELMKAIREKKKKDGSPRTHAVFSESAFNALATALMNEPSYQDTSISSKDGKTVEDVTNPVKDLRKVMIGSVLKKAGADSAEIADMVDTFEFPTLPMYGYTAALLEGYMDTGRDFAFQRRSDLKTTLTMDTIPETTKVTRVPGKKDGEAEPITVIQGEYRRIKAKSPCPPGRKTRI